MVSMETAYFSDQILIGYHSDINLNWIHLHQSCSLTVSPLGATVNEHPNFKCCGYLAKHVEQMRVDKSVRACELKWGNVSSSTSCL